MLVAAVLRLETTGIPESRRLRPDTVSFTPGDKTLFFTVVRGEEDHYLLLKGLRQPPGRVAGVHHGQRRPVSTFKVVTLVQFLRPAGKAYYNLIGPFHHVILLGMCRAGATSGATG